MNRDDINSFIENSLKEDIGSGDHTTLATINKNEINTSKFNLEDLIIWHHDSDTVKVGAARLIQLVKNDLENFNNVSIYSNHALVLVSNGKATQREILSFANNIKDVINETFNISLDIEPTVIN